jgi:hypothetical protein
VIQDRENLHFLYYLDYLRVYAYNFHMKDYKDKVPDRTDGDGQAGGKGWKNDKRPRVEGEQQSGAPVVAVAVAVAEVVAVAETPSDAPQIET